ncbi:ABC transporter permease, partial [Corynebacterium stationis]
MTIAAPEVVAEEQETDKARGGGFLRYVLIRFLLIFPTIFILVTTVFFLMRSTGDPITAALGGRLSAADLERRIVDAGYDRPLLVQYFEYLGEIVRGDFGTTFTDGREVTAILTQYGAATFELVLYALIVALIIGIPLGMIAARFRDRWPDGILRVFAILAYATPVFFVGLLLKLIFSVQLGWFPISGRVSTSGASTLNRITNPTPFYLLDAIRLGDVDLIIDCLRHAALPALALGLLIGGVFLRLV